jgi:hypothetical protein
LWSDRFCETLALPIVRADDFEEGMTLRLWPVLSSNSLVPRLALALLAIIAGALALPIARASNAGGGSLSLAVTPSQLTLSVGTVATGVITITNADLSEEATNVNIEAIPADRSISVAFATAPPTSIPAGASVAVTFTVTRTHAGAAQDVAVQFVATYSQQPMGAAGTTSTTETSGSPATTTATSNTPAGVAQVAVAGMIVHAAATPTLLKASFTSNATLTIDEDRPGESAVAIQNPRDTTLHVNSIVITAPAQVSVTLTCPQQATNRPVTLEAEGGTTKAYSTCHFDVPGQSEATLHASFDPADAVAPGPRTALVAITASSADVPAPQTAVASTDFTVDIFAESALLKSVGVPIFLLLPGFLIVFITWFLLGKLGPFKRVVGSLPSLTNASSIIPAAVLSLLVSLLFAASYPWLTELFGTRRDLRRAYGFEDFYWVLAFSFGIAVVTFGVLCFSGWLFGPAFRWLFVPQAGDDAPGLLRKLALRWPLGNGLHFPLVAVGEAAGKKPALVVTGRGEQELLAPRLEITATTAVQALKDSIQKQIDGEHVFRLWRSISRAQDSVSLTYRADDIGAPQLLGTQKVEPVTGSNLIIRIKPPDES